MITTTFITKESVQQNVDIVDCLYRSYLRYTGPYVGFPEKQDLLHTLWSEAEAGGGETPASYRTFLVAAEDSVSPFCFVSGVWYPASGAAFVECVCRKKPVVYAKQGTILLKKTMDRLSSIGVKEFYMPVPDPDDKAVRSPLPSMPADRLLEWATGMGFHPLSFDFRTPPMDAKGRLREGYLLLRHGGSTASFSSVVRCLGEEYRRLGANPLMAAETIYKTANFDHTRIY